MRGGDTVPWAVVRRCTDRQMDAGFLLHPGPGCLWPPDVRHALQGLVSDPQLTSAPRVDPVHHGGIKSSPAQEAQAAPRPLPADRHPHERGQGCQLGALRSQTPNDQETHATNGQPYRKPHLCHLCHALAGPLCMELVTIILWMRKQSSKHRTAHPGPLLQGLSHSLVQLPRP